MMRIAQRFCQCSYRGFGQDRNSGMWVCGGCGFPKPQYYMALRAEQEDGVPIVYAQGDYWETQLAYIESLTPPATERRRAKPRS